MWQARERDFWKTGVWERKNAVWDRVATRHWQILAGTMQISLELIEKPRSGILTLLYHSIRTFVHKREGRLSPRNSYRKLMTY